MTRSPRRVVTLAIAGCLMWATSARANDELAREASWQPPDQQTIQDRFVTWVDQLNLPQDTRQQIDRLWATPVEDSSPLDLVVKAAALADGRIQQLVSFCRQPFRPAELPQFEILTSDELPAWLRADLRLHYGRWLADMQLYQELQENLSSLDPTAVSDPAALLFFQSVASHRLLEKEECLRRLQQLQENAASVPERYLVIAKLMQADIQPLQTDSLDEISRLMDSVKIQLGHARAGTRVRERENTVIEKLDKLIEQLEQQAAAMAAASAGSSGGRAPSSPMQDSMPGGGSGPGNVDPKELGADSDWGDLPPKEREAALQRLSKDLPSHYRDVVEEYFRKLARDGS